NTIHRDLHSRNILYRQHYDYWYISDLAFCGPANKPSESIYGNLPYIAPEVIAKKEYTKASDIYSIAMIMWEISSGQPPYNNYEHDFDVSMKIIDGIRPEIVPGTPLKYQQLMEQCWNADPLNRPDGNTLIEELRSLLFYQNEDNIKVQTDIFIDVNTDHFKNTTSKVYIFKDVPKPKNAFDIEHEDNGDNIYNNPNLHSEDQDKLEIPECKVHNKMCS
ncbi:8428_t:CDS:2, partial [Funneliformis geosporum]